MVEEEKDAEWFVRSYRADLHACEERLCWISLWCVKTFANRQHLSARRRNSLSGVILKVCEMWIIVLLGNY